MYVAIRIGLSWLIAGILVLDATVANAEMFRGYPDAIICNEGAARVVAYSRRSARVMSSISS
jgi:hypothetical protein